MENLSAAHAFDYILLRIKPGQPVVKYVKYWYYDKRYC